jgi:hypothetical protein
MNKFLFLALLVGCSQHRLFKKNHITLSESPCVDGTVLNIAQAGCEGFYWGTDSDGIILKIRCTYAPKDSMWTKSAFYSVPHGYYSGYTDWVLFCEDRHVKMFYVPYGIKLKD